MDQVQILEKFQSERLLLLDPIGSQDILRILCLLVSLIFQIPHHISKDSQINQDKPK